MERRKIDINLKINKMKTKKKKDLLQDWEIIQQEYYEQFNRSEVEEKYSDWFYNDVDVIENTTLYGEKRND